MFTFEIAGVRCGCVQVAAKQRCQKKLEKLHWLEFFENNWKDLQDNFSKCKLKFYRFYQPFTKSVKPRKWCQFPFFGLVTLVKVNCKHKKCSSLEKLSWNQETLCMIDCKVDLTEFCQETFIQMMSEHSVEIPEICSHHFLTKISWKQLIY